LVVGTVRLVGSHANNVFSNVASSIHSWHAAWGPFTGLYAYSWGGR
jgi:hypothetical protein